MTENYEYVRASIIPELLKSESVSGNAVYPHAIFESGKVAFLDDSDNSGTVTRNYISFLTADRTADFNQVNSHVSALFFYTSKEYELKEVIDPRFIPGRCAEVFVSGVRAGIFGEIHPAVLENWGIDVPCTAAEVDLDLLSR
jgi:phenylalanyl-tRNA synthetase beta chain